MAGRGKEKPDLHRLEKESLTKIEKQAHEVLRQAAFLRRNGDGDQVRFAILDIEAMKLEEHTRRAYNRWKRWSEAAVPAEYTKGSE